MNSVQHGPRAAILRQEENGVKDDTLLDVSSFLTPPNNQFDQTQMVRRNPKRGKALYNTQNSKQMEPNKLIKILARRFLIDSFRQRLMELSSGVRFKKLNKLDRDLIEDISKQCMQQQTSKWTETFNEKFVFQPGSLFSLIWNTYQNVVFLILMFVFPFTYALQVRFEDLFNFDPIYFVVFIEADMLFDILVHSSTGYIYQGQTVIDRTSVIQHYLREDLVQDLLAFMCLQIPLLGQLDLHFIIFFLGTSLFFILKLGIISKSFTQFRDFLNMSEIQNLYIDLFALVFQIVVIGHLFACVWHGVAAYSYQHRTWLKVYGFVEESIWSRYNASFYWATMTMITVGYGDIVPTNDIERLVANFTMFLACGVFAFSLNGIGTVLQSLNKSNENLHKIKQIMNWFMRKHHIKYDLQTRVRSYLDFKLKDDSSKDEDVNEAMLLLSTQLQNELKQEARCVWIQKIKCLEPFSKELKNKITHELEEIRYSPGEIIFSQRKLDDSALYYILEGEIELNFEGSLEKKIISVLKAGEYFGQYSFFSGYKRTLTARSGGYTRLIKLKREALMTNMRGKSVDLEAYFAIKQEVKFNNNLKRLHIKCFSCKGNHLITDCPQTHLNLNKEAVIKREYFPFQQLRYRLYARDRYNLQIIKQRPKQNSRAINKKVLQNQIYYQQNLEKLSQQPSLDAPKQNESNGSQEDEDSWVIPQQKNSGKREMSQKGNEDDSTPLRINFTSKQQVEIYPGMSSATRVHSLLQHEQFSKLPDFDRYAKMQLKTWYNLDLVLKRLKYLTTLKFPKSLYTFNYKAIIKSIRIRQLIS